MLILQGERCHKTDFRKQGSPFLFFIWQPAVQYQASSVGAQVEQVVDRMDRGAIPTDPGK